MSSKSNKLKTAKEKAFRNVYGLDADVGSAKNIRVMENALQDIWSYSGLFRNETDEGRKYRIGLESPAEGGLGEITEYFRKLYPNELKGFPQWQTVFWVYKQMKSSALSDAGEVGTASATDAQPQQADVSDNKINQSKVKERRDMTNEEFMSKINDGESGGSDGRVAVENRLAQLTSQATQTGYPGLTSGSGADPQTSEAYSSAAKDVLKGSYDVRLAKSQSTVAARLVFSGRQLKERCFQAENTKGTVNPDKIDEFISKFKEKAGYEQVAGAVTWRNVPAVEIENANAVLQALEEAKANPDKQFDVNFGNATYGSIKAFYVKGAGKEGQDMYMKYDDLKDYIINNTLGGIATVADGSIIKMVPVKVRNNKKSSSQKSISTEDERQQWANTLRIQNRAKLLDDKSVIMYHKEINKNSHKEQPGAKSVLSCKYYGKSVGADGNKKLVTYRIPLMVDMYVSQVVDKDLEGLLGDGSSAIGRNSMPEYLTNEDTQKKMYDNLLSIIANCAADGKHTSELFESIRAKAAAAREANVQEEAAGYDS